MTECCARGSLTSYLTQAAYKGHRKFFKESINLANPLTLPAPRIANFNTSYNSSTTVTINSKLLTMEKKKTIIKIEKPFMFFSTSWFPKVPSFLLKNDIVKLVRRMQNTDRSLPQGQRVTST